MARPRLAIMGRATASALLLKNVGRMTSITLVLSPQVEVCGLTRLIISSPRSQMYSSSTADAEAFLEGVSYRALGTGFESWTESILTARAKQLLSVEGNNVNSSPRCIVTWISSILFKSCYPVTSGLGRLTGKECGKHESYARSMYAFVSNMCLHSQKLVYS